MEYSSRCIKFNLPDGTCLDILEQVISIMIKWRQIKDSNSEAAGFLLGYQNKRTNNITISNLTEPQPKDIRSRFFCVIKDVIHFNQIKKNAVNQNYYIGVWHTHPQNIPQPSALDWKDWNEALHKDKCGAKYMIFIILGKVDFRVWIGDTVNHTISEIFEAKICDGIYLKSGEKHEDKMATSV